MNRSKAMINVLISVAIQWIDSQIVGVHIQTEIIFYSDSLALKIYLVPFKNFVQSHFFSVFLAYFQISFCIKSLLDVFKQMFLIHTCGGVNVGVNFSAIVEVTMWALLLSFFLLKIFVSARNFMRFNIKNHKINLKIIKPQKQWWLWFGQTIGPFNKSCRRHFASKNCNRW